MNLTKVSQRTFKMETLVNGIRAEFYGSLHTGIEIQVFSNRHRYHYRILLTPTELSRLQEILNGPE